MQTAPHHPPFRRRAALPLAGLALVAPALLSVLVFFVLPLAASVEGAFRTPEGRGLANFVKLAELYRADILFTLLIVGLSTLLTGLIATAIAGYLTLGQNPRAVAILRWLYRWPLFIPFVVTAQIMRTFLAKSGMLNASLSTLGLADAATLGSWLDWRGIVLAFVWKQTPFVTLLLAGAMAALDRGTIEAARNLGASRFRVLWDIVLPQAARTLMTGLILSFVTMMSVLSVPLMINAQSPTMITADIAFRINAYGDYGVANALGVVSLLMTGAFAILYLRLGLRERR
ncbi:ABC transporter permease subunit [Rhodovulum tesquicola]|uniref:ABC transporter permease n=1 Tax=Rhodovulum tesquicola TaxID=540254 RepID=UPI0020982F86|nr:ABC transporter permease subunit [Rhodovulum tesquicola]MCO8146097.1 ABC transporter permease subunit [Rhodovulum tesquicola]